MFKTRINLMNKLASVAVVVLLICGGMLWFLASGSLNDFVKAQIESVGTKTTEQKVSVAQVDIKLTSGAGFIKGLTLANPEKYKADNLFSLNEIGLDINLESLTSEPIVIDEILIKNPQFFVEVNSDGSANIKDILDAINKNTPKSTGQQDSPETQNSTKEPKIKLTKLTIAGVSLSLDLSQLGNKAHQLSLPDINLSNIGGEAGLPASQLGTEITKQLLNAVWKQTKKAQKDKLKAKLKDKAKEKLSDLINKLGS